MGRSEGARGGLQEGARLPTSAEGRPPGPSTAPSRWIPASGDVVSSSGVGRGEATTATVHVLHEGYVRGERVASTVGLVRDDDALVVIDPGMVPDPAAILDPLAALGVRPEEVTDVVLSHHHPDHALHAGLFAAARVHDHWAWYRGDLWTHRGAEGFHVSRDVELASTPGHTREDLTTVVRTDEGVVAFTHLWWAADGPREDPLAEDPAALHASRARILALPDLVRIIPGHGAPFAPGPSTPR
ncbi:MAG TPA: MBL fold metallo-hydrolase [Actinomycetota bacterium]|nr:MBL fold metallo-hydrolase [Actinomycetota bacterium]